MFGCKTDASIMEHIAADPRKFHKFVLVLKALGLRFEPTKNGKWFNIVKGRRSDSL